MLLEIGKHPIEIELKHLFWAAEVARTAPSMGALKAVPPVAISTFLAVTVRRPPAASLTSIVCGSLKLPKPSVTRQEGAFVQSSRRAEARSADKGTTGQKTAAGPGTQAQSGVGTQK